MVREARPQSWLKSCIRQICIKLGCQTWLISKNPGIWDFVIPKLFIISLFEFLRTFSRGEYTILLSSILLRSDVYKSLARLQLIALISFRINITAAWIHNRENPVANFKKFRDFGTCEFFEFRVSGFPDWHTSLVCMNILLKGHYKK